MELIYFFGQNFADDQSVGRRLGKRAGKARAVAQRVDARAVLDLEIHAVRTGGVILAFHAIQRCIIVSGARSDLIERMRCFDNIVKLALRHAQA